MLTTECTRPPIPATRGALARARLAAIDALDRLFVGNCDQPLDDLIRDVGAARRKIARFDRALARVPAPARRLARRSACRAARRAAPRPVLVVGDVDEPPPVRCSCASSHDPRAHVDELAALREVDRARRAGDRGLALAWAGTARLLARRRAA